MHPLSGFIIPLEHIGQIFSAFVFAVAVGCCGFVSVVFGTVGWSFHIVDSILSVLHV